jgi:hypothetical protein
MISTKPVTLDTQLTITDNLDPASNITEENDLQKDKHPSSNIVTDEGE